MRIEGLHWDEEAEAHIARHQVTAREVEAAIETILYARRSRGRLQLIGQTAGGRYLTVILDDEGDGFWYPVTARDTSPSERRLIRRERDARGR